MALQEEISRRRTFAIISHPDAGKTTLTEKLLLYGGAIQTAGSVKGKATAKHAVSDWMDLEKQRGISITSSVLQFEYEGCCVNILDTPGHQDFSEDTYRTLMAADCVVMVIDAAKGIEPQTRKLFHVTAMRHIPIFTFINKLDREARDPFELLDELEKEFGIGTYPINWPIGCGVSFKGVFDREKRQIMAFNEMHRGQERLSGISCDLTDTEKLNELLGPYQSQELIDQIELLDGASFDFDLDKVHRGELTPVFFGSALTNFGVEPFLEYFLKMSLPPLARKTAGGGEVATDEPFSAFVFKIQANMNKAHRDRMTFLRICSGKFERDKEYLHVQGERTMRLSQPQHIMADDRQIINEAYAGDIIGVFDPGIFSIGDTVCDPKTPVRYAGIPTFAPEHFAVIEHTDSLKRKQFVKGVEQIAQEGAIQIFHEPDSGMERVIVGVVGVLQFEVLEYRLKNEYRVDVLRQDLPYRYIRWIRNRDIDVKSLNLTSDTKWVQDFKGNNILIFTGEWNINWALEKNEGLILEDFNEDEEQE